MKKFLYSSIMFICFLSFNLKVLGSNQKIDSLEVLLDNYNRADSIRVNILNDLGYEYWVVDPTLSVKYGNKGLTLAQQISYLKGEAMANRVIGVADWALGNYEEALDRLFPSLKLYQEISDSLGMANVRMNIGLVYAEQLGYQQALEYYFSAEKLFISLGQKGRLATTYTKIGSIYTELKKFEEAFQYLSVALNIHQERTFNYGVAEANNRLGLLFRDQKEYNVALKYLHQSLEISSQIEDLEGKAKCLENLGFTYLLMEDFQKSEKYLQEGLQLAKSIKSKKWLKDIYFDLSQLAKREGKYNDALKYFEKHALIKDSLFDEKKIMEIAAMRLEFEMDKQNKNLEIGKEKIRVLEQRSENRRLWNIFISSFLILGVSLAYFIFSKQRGIIKRDRALNESREELAQVNLENARLKEVELKQELENRNKELTSYTVNFIRKNELMEEIKEDLSELERDKNLSGKLKTVLRKVNNNSSLDKDWEDFKFHFEQVHVGFFQNLLKQHSNLTSGDLRLAALIRMNLNLKESASILGISSESVKTSRYRLRKKLDISKEDNLSDYIIRISSVRV